MANIGRRILVFWLRLLTWRSLPSSRLILFVSLLISTILLAGPAAAAEEPTPDLGLTSAEKAWIVEHPEIRLAVDIDWAPFEFVDGKKKYRGMAAEYIRLVEKRLGIRLKIDKVRPWQEMVEAVKNRDLDAFSLVVRTPQRDEFVNFTKPYISVPMVIVTLEDEPFVDGIEALRKRTVAVVESYASHDLLARNHPHLKLHLTKNVRRGLEAVSNGQAYAFVGNLAVAGQVIRETGISNLKISGQTPYRFDLSMAVRKDWPEFVPILQKALDSVSPEERDQIYSRWIHLEFPEGVDYRIVLAVLGVGLLIVSIILFWNRKLRREIEHRHKAEAHLRESEERFRVLVQNNPYGIQEIDTRGYITFTNPAHDKIYGYPNDEMLGMSIWELLAFETEQEKLRQYLEELVREQPSPAPYLEQDRTKDGRLIDVLVHWAYKRDGEGNVIGFISTLSDITERKLAEQQLLEAKEQAELANRSKTEFLANMSHELRTPLNSVIGFSEILEGEFFGALGSDKNREYVADIKNSGEHLLKVISDILDVSRIEVGMLELEEEEVDIGEILTTSIAMVQMRANQAQVTISSEMPAEDPILLADPTRIKQILLNLLSNAIKFTAVGGKATVTVVQEDSGSLTLRVTDTGVGIEPEFLDLVFEPFSQTGDTMTRSREGTGLGLSLTKSLTELHDGTLELESELGVGTTATVWFPPERVIRRSLLPVE